MGRRPPATCPASPPRWSPASASSAPGTIIRNQDKVKGLTTAATLWLAAGIGVAAGAGLVLLSVAALVITMLVLVVFRVFDPLLRRAHERRKQHHRAIRWRGPERP